MNDLQRTEWMHKKKWGVMIHHLEGMINNEAHPKAWGRVRPGTRLFVISTTSILQRSFTRWGQAGAFLP